MSNEFLFVLSGKSDVMKVVRFFEVVGFLGGIVWFMRAMIALAIFGGILFLIR